MKGHWAQALALIAANLLPLYGVQFWHWSVLALVVLYWLEVLIFGVLAIPRTLLVDPSNVELWLHKAVEIPFFCALFGALALAIGTIIYVLLGQTEGVLGFDEGILPVKHTLLILRKHHLWPALGALIAAHVVGFLIEDVARGGFRSAKLRDGMIRAFNRFYILFLALLWAYGFLSLGSPLWALFLLVVLKLSLELHEHLRHWRAVANAAGTA